MNTNERLNQIQARADAATPQPWVYLSRNVIDTPPVEVDEADWGPEGHSGLKIHTIQETRAYRYADAQFVAAARQDVPALVNALRAVLHLHREVPPLSNPDPTPICRNCDEDWPCSSATAIESALGDPQ